MSQKSFTLIELLGVIGIIVILTAIIFPNYRVGASQFALERSAYKLAQDIRRAAEMAMSAKEFEEEIPKGGYGAHFSTSWQAEYKLYADKNGNEEYNEGEKVETIRLEKGVIIKEISYPELSINFKPPAPTVKLSQDSTFVTIILALEADPTKTKTIKVNKAGLIDVE